MAGATFSRVKTWIAGETLTASDLNAEFNNFLNNLNPSGIDDESANDAAAQATSDPYAGDSLVKATSLQGEIQQIRYLLAQITGETYWYVDPDSDIATIHAALNGLDPSSIDDESADDAAARATKDPYADSSLVRATSLQEEIQELRYLIAQITGETYWYIDPDTNVATIVTDLATIVTDLATIDADDWVTTTKIKDANVTTAKIADDNVTGPKLSAGTYPWLGYFNRATFTYNGGATAYTVKVKAGTYHVKDKLAFWITELTTDAIGTPAADTWYYLYLDYSEITEGTAVTASELVWSTTAPSWSDTYQGWYNGDDRCIFAARSNAGPTNILEFFHEGEFVAYADHIEDRATADLDNAWVDVTLTMPGFSTMAECTFYGYANGDNGTARADWRTNGQTGATGHYVLLTDAENVDFAYNTLKVITDSSNIIEVKHSFTGDHQLGVFTDGWYFPRGM